MAVFKEETTLYEILIRVNPDKTWAAHYQTLTEVKKDGIVISANVNDVLPLKVEDEEAYNILINLVGDIAANTLLENRSLKEQLDIALHEIELLRQQNSVQTS